MAAKQNESAIKNHILTVFTPTYNRAYILPKLFESLQAQSNLDFEWLIIDDGSTDDTRDTVSKFKESAKFKIEYLYKVNGGKHTAINSMLEVAEAEIVLIVDSDDFLYRDAVETVLKDYENLKGNVEICELVYLRTYFDGRIIGEKFPVNDGIVNPIESFINSGLKGDKCSVIVMNIFRQYRFPVYREENFMGESVLWHKIYSEYNKVYVRNKGIYYCEYVEDGLTAAGRRMRIKNPLGGMAHANSYMIKDVKSRIKFKRTLLFICYGFFANKTFKDMYRKLNDKRYFIINYPFGFLLYLYWKIKYQFH